MLDRKPDHPAQGGSLKVQHAHPEDAAAWDEFVESHPEGRYSHLWGFRRPLEKVCGYQCVYLKFLLDNRLVGVFPSIKIKRRGLLISQPFNEYGGPLTGALSGAQYAQLTNLLVVETRRLHCSSIEIRGGIGCEEAASAGGWKKQPLHSYAVLDLDDPERLWKKVVSYEARKGVNKARKSGLTSEVRCAAQAVSDPFYSLYLSSMKRLGVPPHSKLYFQELATGIGDRLVASWVFKGNQVAAILLGAATGRRIHIFVIASASEAWPMRPADLAHWELIQWACNQGLKVFDFGSVRYGGQVHFKKKWGVVLHDYGFYLVGPPETMEKLKVQTVKTSSKSMNAMAAIWRRAVPLPLTRLLGPPIRSFLTK